MKQTLAQASFGHLHFFNAKTVHHFACDQRAGQDDIRAVPVQSRDVFAPGERQSPKFADGLDQLLS